VTINCWEDGSQIRRYFKDQKITLTTLLSISCKPDATVAYKASFVPTTYLIDPKGRIAGRYSAGAVEAIKKDLPSLGFNN
jgi:hypothetical protein